jgi:hypothetical protein
MHCERINRDLYLLLFDTVGISQRIESMVHRRCPPSETVAIIVVLAKAEVKQSFRMRVRLEARYGMCLLLLHLLLSRAHAHYFNARSEVLISTLSVRRWVLCDLVSFPRSLPARSTSESFPVSFPDALSRKIIWQIAWDREEVSFASVAWVVRTLIKRDKGKT